MQFCPIFSSSVQFSRSVVSDSFQPHGLQHARPPWSITNSRSLLKLMSIESVMPSNHLILCHPLLHLSSIFPSIRVFSNESALHNKWPKYWSFSFSISPSNEHPGLIFRMDSLHPLAVQRTLKSLLQHHSSKASILGHSAFFIVQLSHLYMTTGKTIALTRQTFVGKVMLSYFHNLKMKKKKKKEKTRQGCPLLPLLFNILLELLVTILREKKKKQASKLEKKRQKCACR